MPGLDLFTLEDFKPLVGTDFLILESDHCVALTLTEAELSGQGGANGRPFYLLFLGPTLPALAQRTYHLTHAQRGELEIFLVPISSTIEQRVYEAIFA